MKKNKFAVDVTRASWLTILLAALLLIPGAGAGQKKNKKEKAAENQENPVPLPPVPTPEQLDMNIGEMLGAWQAGDAEGMHKYYADEATFVSGGFEPPIVGWKNYVAAYQKQRARIQGMQFVRRNTSIYFRTDIAWASYQWEFDAMVDNAPLHAVGQTTLVFAVSGGRWVIVHNHTSEICNAAAPTPATPPAGTDKPSN